MAVRTSARAVALLLLTTAAPCVSLLAAAPAWGNETAQADAQRYRFDIPSQPLAGALAAFTRITGIEVSATPGLTEDRTSPGVRGNLTVSAALGRLLSGTGVTFAFAGGDTAVLAAAAPADDGTRSLDAVVVSATRTATPVSELTRSVTVVDREAVDENKKVDRNLSDLMAKSVPGMSPGTESLSTFTQTLRGRDFLTLIDGIPQSTPLRSASRDLNTIDPDAIERIEVVRGGTAAYGFGATGGMVNIITRRPEEGAFNAHSEVGARISTEHVNDSLEWQTHHQVSGREGAWDYLVNGTLVQRQSYFDADGDRIPPDPMGVQGGLADTDEWNVLAKAGYEWAGKQRLEFSLNHFDFLQDTDYTFGTGDASTGTKTPAVPGSSNVADPGTRNTVATAKYRNGNVHGSALEAQAYYSDLTARFAKFPGFAQTEVLSEKFGARATVETPLKVTKSQDVNLIWGVDLLRDETVQAGIDGPTVVPVMEQKAVAGFIEAEVPVGSWGLVRGGVRHERISVDVDDVVNRNSIFVNGGTLNFNENLFNLSGVVYITPEAELYAGFSQGFSVADIGRAIRDGTLTEATQLESEAQKVNNYEIGVRGARGPVNASAAGFYSTSEKGTTFDSNLNLRKAPERIWGLEGSLDYKPQGLWGVGGTATMMWGEVDLDNDGDYEEDLPNTRVPPLKLTGYLDYQATERANLRLSAVYSGARDPNSTQFGGNEVDGYLLFDLVAVQELDRGTLSVGIKNLLNEDYFPLRSQASATSYGFTKGPGRSIGVTYALKW